MKHKFTSEFIDAPPLPASSVCCLHYRPTEMDMLNLSRDAGSWNVICIGTQGSGKTFDVQGILNRVPPVPRRVFIYDEYWVHSLSDAAPHPLRYLQHVEKGRVS
jgi:hypothetical protein